MGITDIFHASKIKKEYLKKLSNGKFETNEHVIGEEFDGIYISSVATDVSFLASDEYKVVCYEPENLNHTVSVKDGRLAIEVNDERKWHDLVKDVSFSIPKITVYLPRGEYGVLKIDDVIGDICLAEDFVFAGIDISKSKGDTKLFASSSGEVKIKATSGRIEVKGINAASLDLALTTGDITVSEVECKDSVSANVRTGMVKLENVSCKSLSASAKTGDVFLDRVVAEDKFDIICTTGGVNFKACDAAEITVETSTGNVLGTLLSEKVFIHNTKTGVVDLPESASGGRCKITTATGDIKISVEQK